MSDNKRIAQLTFMLSDITGIGGNEARGIIVSTEVGKLILDNNSTVLYEQQTENLYEIAREISERKEYENIVSLLTIPNIVNAGKRLREHEKRTVRDEVPQSVKVGKNVQLKQKLNQQNLMKRKTVMAIKKQNKMNLRRMKNAD
jgi:ribosomal protein S13